MATAQLSRTESGQWAATFPPEQITESQSIMFVKKLLATAVSSITYLRALFPENAFGDRCLEDVSLKILRDDSNFPDACKVVHWLRGCFDALEKKYLRSVLIGIYVDPEDPDTVIEQYSFRIAYGDADGTGIDIYRNGSKLLSAKSDLETKKATIRLLRTIVLLNQTLLPLPDNVMMTMKLLYYDEVTPEDYNPPGFKECESDSFSFMEDEKPVSIKLGDVATHFHSFKLRLKTIHHDLQNEEFETVSSEKENSNFLDEEAVVPLEEKPCREDIVSMYPSIDSETEVLEKKNAPEIHVGDEVTEVREPLQEIPMKLMSLTMNDSDMNADEYVTASNVLTDTNKKGEYDHAQDNVNDEGDVEEEEDEEEEPTATVCPCGVNEDDGLMILCATCNYWQHGICFGIIDSDDAPETHYCVDCTKKDNSIQCTDKGLAKIDDDKKIMENCLWRRTLLATAEFSRILPTSLSKRLNIPVSVASNLMRRLETESFLKSTVKAKRFGKMVLKTEIMERGVAKYFQHGGEIVSDSENIEHDVERAPVMEIDSERKTSFAKRKSVFISPENQKVIPEISNSPLSQTNNKRRKTSVSADPMLV